MAARSKSLDFLRAIAILLVLGHHLVVCPAENNFFLHIITTTLQRGGWVGVDLFFVLSGFLISGLLFTEHKRFGAISLKRFFIRRGFKIYPAFYTLIFVTVFWYYRGRVDIKELLTETFFLQDYFRGLWQHTWSLAVEEQFYLFLPILLIILYKTNGSPRQPFKIIKYIFFVIAVTCLGLRFLNSVMLPYGFYTHMIQFHFRIDSLFFGVLISYYYNYHQAEFIKIAKRFKYLFLVLGVILFIPPFIFRRSAIFMHTVELSFLYMASGLILIALLENRFIENSRGIKILAYIGSHSYSIYLWHIPMSMWGVPLARRLLPFWNWEVHAAVYLAGAIFAGICASKIIEFPMLKLRDRFYPTRSKLSL